MTEVDHRRLGVDLFNRTWTLMEQPDRSVEGDDELLHCAHASAYHWQQVGTAANRARSEWLCSRAYTVLGRGEPALHHARRCLAIVEGEPAAMDDWDLTGAYEAMARAFSTAGDMDQARRFHGLGVAASASIADPEDREHLVSDLATIPIG